MTASERTKAAKALGRRGGIAAARSMSAAQKLARTKASHDARRRNKERRLAGMAATPGKIQGTV